MAYIAVRFQFSGKHAEFQGAVHNLQFRKKKCLREFKGKRWNLI